MTQNVDERREEDALRHLLLVTCLFWCVLLVACGPNTPGGDVGDEASPDEATAGTFADEDAGQETGGDLAVEDAAGPDVAEDAAEPADAENAAKPIRTPEQLSQALTERNPEFQGPVEWQALGPELVAVTIHDPNLREIGPLSRVPLGALDISKCDVTDLKPLAGVPLITLYAEENRRLTDIEPLRGMPLRELYLSYTRVENLGPLRGLPLVQVNLVGTRVKDISPLSESPVEMLWLSECPVKDISPLKQTPLVSLTVENTPVDDIRPLEGHAVERLHIGGTAVSDLTPLQNMRLTRLIFTPGRVKKGMEFARAMQSIREIGTNFDTRMPPHVFWQLYDAGKIQ